MNLEEYKAHVEAQRKASLEQAIATLTKANKKLTDNFNIEENN